MITEKLIFFLKLSFFIFAFIGIIDICISTYFSTKIVFDIRASGKLPKVFEDFPIHLSSYDEYLEIKQRIKEFINAAISGHPYKLLISESDLNNLYTKGITLNKFNLGNFKYYSIINNEVIEKEMTLPDSNGIYGFRSKTKRIRFTGDGHRWEESVITEINGKVKKNPNSTIKKIPLLGSEIIEYIFDDRISPPYAQAFFPTKKLVGALSGLKTLEIRDGLIIFEA